MPIKNNNFIPKNSELFNKNYPNNFNSRNNSIFPNVNNFNKSNFNNNNNNNIRNKYYNYNSNNSKNSKNIFDVDYTNINNTQNINSYNNNFKYNDIKYVIKRRQSIEKNNSKITNSNTIENNLYSIYNKRKENKFNISNSYYDTKDTNPHITYSFHTNSNLKNRIQSAKFFSSKKNNKNKNNNNHFITLNMRPNSSLNPNETYRNKIRVYDIYTNKLLKKQEEINKRHYNEKYKHIGTETVDIEKNKTKINNNNIKNDNKQIFKNVNNNNLNISNSNQLNFSLITNKDKNDYSSFLYKFNNKNFIKDFSKKIINNKKNLQNNKHQMTSNKFLKEILKNIYRKIEYLNQKNKLVYEDNVMNLLENEYKEINKNIDLQMEAYCNIKNFSAIVNNEIQNNKNKINYNESYLVPFINNIIAPFYEKQKKLISPFITNYNEGLNQKNNLDNLTINNGLRIEQINDKNSFNIDQIKIEDKTKDDKKKNILTKEKLEVLYNTFKLKATLIPEKEQKKLNNSNIDNFNSDDNSYNDNDEINENNIKKKVSNFGLTFLEKNLKIFEKYLKNKIGIKKTTSHFNFHLKKYYLNKNKIRYNSSYDKFKMKILHNKIYIITQKLLKKNKNSKFDKYKAEILLPFFGQLKITSRELIRDLYSGKTRKANYEKNLRNQQEENKKIELINEEKNFNIKLEEEKKMDLNEYNNKTIIEENEIKNTNEKEEKKYFSKKYSNSIKIDTDIDNDSKQTPTTYSTKYSSSKFIKYSYAPNNLNKKSDIKSSKTLKNDKKKKEDFEIYEKNSSSSENSITSNVNNKKIKQNKKTRNISKKTSLNSLNQKSDSKPKSTSKNTSKRQSFVKNSNILNEDVNRRKRHSLTIRSEKQIEGLKKSENINDININFYKPNLDLIDNSDSIDSDDIENLTLNKNKYIKNYNEYLKQLRELYKDEIEEYSDSEEESVKEKKSILKKNNDNNNAHKNKNKISFQDSPVKNEKIENKETSNKKSVPLKLHIKFSYNKSKSQITRDILRSLRGKNYDEKNIDNESFDIEEYRIIKNLLKEKKKEKKTIILKKNSIKEKEINENKKEEDFREKYIRAKKQRDSVIKINWDELEKDDDDDEENGFFKKISEKEEEYNLSDNENKNENDNKDFSGRKKIKIKTFKMKDNKAFDNFLKMIQKLKDYNVEEYMKQIGQKYNVKENPKEYNEQQERINKFRENLINNMDQNEAKRKIRSNKCIVENYENFIGNKLV